MASQFALRLSFNSIALLLGTPRGWQTVSDLLLPNPALQTAMGDLCDEGKRLSETSGDLPVLLLLPDEQIKYLSTADSLRDGEEVKSVLEGETPFDVSDLLFDYVPAKDGGTHIAAVAKGTLDEAEGFAQQSGFAPLGFGAIAPDETFGRLVDFGRTGVDLAEGWADIPLRVFPAIERHEEPVEPQPAMPAFAQKRPAHVGRPQPPAPVPPSVVAQAKAPASRAGLPPAPPISADVAERLEEVHQRAAHFRDTLPKPSGRSLPLVQSPEAAIDGFRRLSEVGGTKPPSRKGKPFLLAGSLFAIASGIGIWIVSGTMFGNERSLVAALEEPILAVEAEPTAQSSVPDTAPIVAAEPAPVPDTVEQTDVVEAPSALELEPQPEPVAVEVAAGEPTLPIGPAVHDEALAAISPPATPERSFSPEVIAAPPREAAEPTVVTAPTTTSPISPPANGRVLTPTEARRLYAATGVWQRAARVVTPAPETALTFSRPVSIAPASNFVGVSALQAQANTQEPQPLRTGPAPSEAPRFALDARGVIPATAEGALTPYGFRAFTGQPSPAPRLRPVPEQPVVVRPKLRPIQPSPVTEAPEAPVVESPAIAQTVAPEFATGNALAAVTGPSAPEPITAPNTSGSEPAVSDTAEQTVVVLENPALSDVRPVLRPREIASEAPEEQLDSSDVAAAPLAIAPAAPLTTGTAQEVISSTPLAPSEPPAEERPSAGVDIVVFQNPALSGVRPLLRPRTEGEALTIAPSGASENLVRPVLRPSEAVAPSPERASAPDRAAAYTGPRPALRPRVITPQAAPEPQVRVASTPRPRVRPTNRRSPTTRTARQSAAPAAPAARTVRPSGQTNGAVAQQATQRNAINLNRTNLIGIAGTQSNRRAMVRLSSGGVRVVSVGDRLEGGRVRSITENSLRYTTRGGRTETLRLVN